MPLPDRSGNVLVVSAVFLGIATLFTALRCISKFGIRKRVDTDDLVTILAWVSLLCPVRRPNTIAWIAYKSTSASPWTLNLSYL